MKTVVVVTGVKEIDRRLRTLPIRVQKKIVRKSMRSGLKIMASEVKAQVPIDTGLTRSAVKVRAVKRRKRDTIELEVQISGKVPGLVKTTAAGKRVFYPAVVEYGSSQHPPNPFMKRAFDSKADAARNETMESLVWGVEQEATNS